MNTNVSFLCQKNYLMNQIRFFQIEFGKLKPYMPDDFRQEQRQIMSLMPVHEC